MKRLVSYGALLATSLTFALYGMGTELALVAVSAITLWLLLTPKMEQPRPRLQTTSPLHQRELEQILKIVGAGQSLLVVGEAGSGKTTVAQRTKEAVKQTGKPTALVYYSGSIKETLNSIGEQLNIPLENENGKALNAEQAKAEISMNLKGKLLIIDDAHHFPKSLLLWLEKLHKAGKQIMLFSIDDPQKGIYLRLGKIELGLPSEQQIRDIMMKEALSLGLSLSPHRLSQLQQHCGRNLLLAKRVIGEELLGLAPRGDHREYIDISPFIMAALAGLGIVRFLGLGTGDRTLYIIGGIAMLCGMMLKYLGAGISRANRGKRLGK